MTLPFFKPGKSVDLFLDYFDKNYKHVNIEMEGDQNQETEWKNRADEVFRNEVGVEDYKKRLELQNKLFQKATQETALVRSISMPGNSPNLGLVSLRLHPNLHKPKGVGASGFAVILPREELIPETEFFTPGRLFEVRAIHTNYPDASDDRVTGYRALAIKFEDHHSDSPLDLICHTGYINPFFSAQALQDYIQAQESEEAFRNYLLKMPVYLRSHIEGMRRMPGSYYRQHYHGSMVYDFYGKDAIPYLARFRIVPADGSMESGRLSSEQQNTAWELGRPEGTTKLPPDYLKKEFIGRLENGPVDYLLQVQLHEPHQQQCHMMYNPAMPWDDTLHPWVNLAKISLSRELPDDVAGVTRFHVANLPECIRLPPPQSSVDFNVVPKIMKEACDNNNLAQPTEVEHLKGDLTEYTILLASGNKTGAHAEGEVSISIVGTKGSTTFRKLVPRQADDFVKMPKNLFSITDKAVGEFLCAKVHFTPKDVKKDWYLGYIILSTPYDGKSYTLPCYRWFTQAKQQITLRDGAGCLSMFEKNNYLQQHRLLELQERRSVYKWRPINEQPEFEDYPTFLSNPSQELLSLPKDIQFEGIKETEEEWKHFLGKMDEIVEKVRIGFDKALMFLRRVKPLEAFEDILSDLKDQEAELKHVFQNWTSDTEFGRQIMNGPNPMKLKETRKIPDNFPVTNDMVQEFLETDKTLAGELREGKVYLLSYPELSRHTSWNGDRTHYICDPMCLLYSCKGELVPIAIQLTQTPKPETPIFLPSDSKGEVSDWLMAKLWVRVADANYHILSEYVLHSHLVLEPVAIATLRQLPSVHPVYKLLAPHLRYLSAVNALWRKMLLPSEGALSQVLALGEMKGENADFIGSQYSDFRFRQLHLPSSLSSRGLTNQALLPDYYLRDDGLRVWEAIKQLCTDIVASYYGSDSDVKDDPELSAFIQELNTEGYHQNVGIPDSFIGREDLISFLTSVIFTCSGYRSAVSDNMLTTYAFTPNAPPFLLVAPPTEKTKAGISAFTLRKILPPIELSLHFLEMNKLLRKLGENTGHLGEYPEKYFTELKAEDAIRRFKLSLLFISFDISERTSLSPSLSSSSFLPDKIPAYYAK